MTETNTPPPQPETIPPLTDQYHKARRNYGAVAVILFIWEFIGVDITPSATHRLLGFEFTLKSPEGAQLALVALVIYFGTRLTIEWTQNARNRRQVTAARVDYALSHFIGFAAVYLYVFQLAGGKQLAERIVDAEKSLPIITASQISIIFTLVFLEFQRKLIQKKHPELYRKLSKKRVVFGVYLLAASISLFLLT